MCERVYSRNQSLAHYASVSYVTMAHSMTGLLIGATAAGKRDNLYAVLLTAVLTSALLDVDSLLQIYDYGLYVRKHRLLTHTVFAAPVFAALAASPAWIRVRDRYLFYYLIALFSIAAHLLMDMVCSWPLLLLFPFSDKDFSLDYIGFSSNIVLLSAAGLSIGVLYFRHMRKKQEKPADAGD